MEKIVSIVVKATRIPVTVKTRLGWDENSIRIVEVAKMLEGIGVQGLTVHCRSRAQAHTGIPVNMDSQNKSGRLNPGDRERKYS